jgi:hypothetical protein
MPNEPTDEQRKAQAQRAQADQEQQASRDAEVLEWKKHDSAALYAKTQKGWRAWEAITYDDEAVRREEELRKRAEDADDAPRLVSLTSERTLRHEDGWFKQIPPKEGDAHIRFINGSAYPANIDLSWDPNDTRFKNYYSQTMDYCAGELGENLIIINFDELGGQKYQRDQIIMLVKMAQEKGNAIDFGTVALQVIENMSKEDREALFKARDQLAVNRVRNEIITGMNNSHLLEGLAKSIANEPKMPDAPVAGQSIHAQFTEKAYNDYKDDLGITTPLTDNQKLDAVEKELGQLERRLNRIDVLKAELNSHLSAYEQVLNDPTALQKAPEIKELRTFSERLKAAMSKKEDTLNDDSVVIAEVENSFQEMAGKRDALITAIKNEQSEVDDQRNAWRDGELAVLRTRITAGPDLPKIDELDTKIQAMTDRINASTTAITTIEAKATRISDRIDAAKVALEARAAPRV